MQAIITKYLPATSKNWRGSITIGYPYDVSGQDCHIKAVESLVERFVKEDADRYGATNDTNPWLKPGACGQLPNGEYAHVFIPTPEP